MGVGEVFWFLLVFFFFKIGVREGLAEMTRE